MSCPAPLGARAGLDDVQGGGYRACPRCVNEATATFVCPRRRHQTFPGPGPGAERVFFPCCHGKDRPSR
jgi:hypothetical protein